MKKLGLFAAGSSAASDVYKRQVVEDASAEDAKAE